MRDNQGSNKMRDATFSRRDVLGVAAGALAVGAALAEPLKAAAPEPSAAGPDSPSWVDTAMPEVTHVSNGWGRRWLGKLHCCTPTASRA
jgi:hypothetical protein